MFDICGSPDFFDRNKKRRWFWIADVFQGIQPIRKKRSLSVRGEFDAFAGPFEGPANDKPPALPEVHGWGFVICETAPGNGVCTLPAAIATSTPSAAGAFASMVQEVVDQRSGQSVRSLNFMRGALINAD
jgi:hypothetical protein